MRYFRPFSLSRFSLALAPPFFIPYQKNLPLFRLPLHHLSLSPTKRICLCFRATYSTFENRPDNSNKQTTWQRFLLARAIRLTVFNSESYRVSNIKLQACLPQILLDASWLVILNFETSVALFILNTFANHVISNTTFMVKRSIRD